MSEHGDNYYDNLSPHIHYEQDKNTSNFGMFNWNAGRAY
jgi:hypothetical protein